MTQENAAKSLQGFWRQITRKWRISFSRLIQRWNPGLIAGSCHLMLVLRNVKVCEYWTVNSDSHGIQTIVNIYNSSRDGRRQRWCQESGCIAHLFCCIKIWISSLSIQKRKSDTIRRIVRQRLPADSSFCRGALANE